MRESTKNRVKSLQISLRRVLSGKVAHTHEIYDYLGCNAEEFKKHIESHFLEGMNWDNKFSMWELGHVIPVVYFDHNDLNDLTICWSYKNIIPMLKTDNKYLGSCILFAENYFKTESDVRYMNKIKPHLQTVYKYKVV